MLKNVVCVRCNLPFTTKKTAAKISKVFEKEGRQDLQETISLCPD